MRLTGIGARRASEPVGLPIYGAMPRSHAAAYHRHPQTEVVAVCDIRQEALDSFQREWADIWPDVRCYTDYRAMLAQEKPDLVSVCTPDHLHADITVDAANGGARAILCEKPIATTLADADRMLAAAETNNVLLSIEHTRRWSPIFLKARQMIRSGEYGPLRGITANLYSLRSMLFRNGTHLMDMICFFADADPAWVFAELEEGFAYFTEYKKRRRPRPQRPTRRPRPTSLCQSGGAGPVTTVSRFLCPVHQFELVCDKRVSVSDRGVTVIQGDHGMGQIGLPVDDYMYTYPAGRIGRS